MPTINQDHPGGLGLEAEVKGKNLTSLYTALQFFLKCPNSPAFLL